MHTVHGALLFAIKSSDLDEAATEVALNHHERWDGKGYPGYLHIESGTPLSIKALESGTTVSKVGKDIPLFGRIVAITDVFDALMSKRVYKESWTEEQSLEIMMEEKAKHFDPELLDHFISRLPEIRQIQKRYQEEVVSE